MQVTQHFSLWLRLVVLVTAFCLSVVSHPLVVDECGPLSLEGKPSYLWEVTHPDRTAKSYLFGTITVPAPLVLNSMPANVLRTLHSSDELVLELNPFDPSSPRKMRACSRFSNATTMLGDVIPRALYRRVVAHLRRVQRLMKSWVTPKQISLGLSPKLLFSVAIRDWNRKKPGWVNELIRSLNMRSVSNKHTVGMEMNFALYANYFKKPVSGIDSFEDHCDMVNGMTDEQHFYTIGKSLEKNFTQEIDELTSHYNCFQVDEPFTRVQMLEKLRTNAERLSDADVAMEMGIFNYNYDNVVVKRTKAIVARMDELLSANREKSYFFALSLSKLIGGSETRWSTRRSLVDQLVDIGYQVRRLPAEYSSPRS